MKSVSACVSPMEGKTEINQNFTLILIFKECTFKNREIDNSKHVYVTSCNSKHQKYWDEHESKVIVQ